MTDAFTKECLYDLANQSGGPCVSVFLPTHDARQPHPNDRSRLQRLLRRARRRLMNCMPGGIGVYNQLETVEALVRDRKFWQQQSMGLAVFVAERRCSWFRVPITLPESESLSSNFQLKPLLPLLAESARFFVLAVSQCEVRLLECTREIATEIQIAGPPPPSDAALLYPEFLQRVAQRIQALAKCSRSPIVVAGEALFVRLFRTMAEKLNVLPESIAGSPDGLSTSELHRRGLEILQVRAERTRRQQAEIFAERIGRGGASEHIEEILPAAFLGGIDSLFLAPGAQKWGKYDISDWIVHSHTEFQEGDQDLMDLAAVMTYFHDGSVFVVDREEIPRGRDLAAVFR